MAQVTWRCSDELADRVKRAAQARQCSVNEYLSIVLDVVTDPERAPSDAERIRERLRQADLLVPLPRGRSGRRKPSRSAVEAAATRAAQGTQLSDLISEGR